MGIRRTRLLLVPLLFGLAGCVTTNKSGAKLAFFSSGKPIAEGLHSTFVVLHTWDDCGKLDLPGVDCSKEVWSFEGTTLEVDAPPGFEVLATGLRDDYWFSVRCVKAPATRTAELAVRVKDAKGVRYHGTVDIACAPVSKLAVIKLSIGDNARPGFTEPVDAEDLKAGDILVPVDAEIDTELTLRDADGTDLYGWGRALESADGAFVLADPEQPPIPPGGVQTGPVLRSNHPGTEPTLRVGARTLALPVRAVADSDWTLGLDWSSDEHGTHVDARGLLGSGARVYGLTNCRVTFTDAKGEQPAQTGSCKQYWLVPNVRKVCVSTRGKELCR